MYAGTSPNDLLQTPEWVWKPLGPFDLDPCAGPNTVIGVTNWNIKRGDNGLRNKWSGTFFCNPPFSKKGLWIRKVLKNKDLGGVLLLPERLSAPWAVPLLLGCDAYWVMGRKINFIGGSSSNNVGSILFLWGDEMINRVIESGLPGHLCNVVSVRSRNGKMLLKKEVPNENLD